MGAASFELRDRLQKLHYLDLAADLISAAIRSQAATWRFIASSGKLQSRRQSNAISGFVYKFSAEAPMITKKHVKTIKSSAAARGCSLLQTSAAQIKFEQPIRSDRIKSVRFGSDRIDLHERQPPRRVGRAPGFDLAGSARAARRRQGEADLLWAAPSRG